MSCEHCTEYHECDGLFCEHKMKMTTPTDTSEYKTNWAAIALDAQVNLVEAKKEIEQLTRNNLAMEKNILFLNGEIERLRAENPRLGSSVTEHYLQDMRENPQAYRDLINEQADEIEKLRAQLEECEHGSKGHFDRAMANGFAAQKYRTALERVLKQIEGEVVNGSWAEPASFEIIEEALAKDRT